MLLNLQLKTDTVGKHQLKLSVLDQSIVRKGGTAKQALEETIITAKRAEELGYHRFWVSEHHGSSSIAGSAPELLMVKLADETTSIRIGSGGIMLPNHSALKVAENFRMLETLFPGRIDLGMGRAPGGDRIHAALLNPSNDFAENSYLEQLEHLQHYFRDSAKTQYGPVLAVPQAATVPAQWILSSSGDSARIAARFGMGLAIAKFINGQAPPEIVDIYRNKFKGSERFPEPHAILSITVLCGETEQIAHEMRAQTDYRLLQFEKGNFEQPGGYDSIKDVVYSPEEQARIRHNRHRMIAGTKDQVKEQLQALADAFDVDEIVVATMTYSFEQRLRSFELLAEAFDLPTS